MGKNSSGNRRIVEVVLTDSGGGMRYPSEIWDEVLVRISCGESLKKISSEEGFPHWTNVNRRVLENKEFAEKYNEARKMGFSMWADEVKEISDTTNVGVIKTTRETEKGIFVETKETDMTEHRKLQVDSRKWLLARLDQNRFGDKQLHGSDPNNPMTVEIIQFIRAPKP